MQPFIYASEAYARKDLTDLAETHIYSGNLENRVGKTRVERYEIKKEFLDRVEPCFENAGEYYKQLLDSTTSIEKKERFFHFCPGLKEKWNFIMVRQPSGVHLNFESLMQQRIVGWLGPFESGDDDVNFQVNLEPLSLDLWRVTTHTKTGREIYKDEENYLWARDIQRTSWFGRQPSNIDGKRDLRGIRCIRNGCRSIYSVPKCPLPPTAGRSFAFPNTEVRLIVSVKEDELETEFLEKFDLVHTVAERMMQGFLLYSCEKYFENKIKN
ncbi:MAG: hypothetical protein AAF429_11360 [Pseudomonadota bacterium]